MAKKVDVDHQFGEVTEQLERIEKPTLADHKRRIGRLEGEILQAPFFETAFLGCPWKWPIPLVSRRCEMENNITKIRLDLRGPGSYRGRRLNRA